MLGMTISTPYLFLQSQDFQVQTTFSLKNPWLQKLCLASFEERHQISLSRRSCQVGTIPKRRAHGMETRSMAKAAAMVDAKQTATPSPKQQDL